MKRTYTLLSAVIACLAGGSAVAAAHGGAPQASAARAGTVELRNTSVGRILVNASGFTLYEFTRDSRDRNTCIKVSGCSAVWPALTSSRPTAGSGVKGSLLSTIKLPGGAKQVTYAGHPLYLYREASERGETAYVGVSAFGGRWDALSASAGRVG